MKIDRVLQDTCAKIKRSGCESDANDCLTEATETKSMTEFKPNRKRPVTAKQNQRYKKIEQGTHYGKESWYKKNIDLQIQKLQLDVAQSMERKKLIETENQYRRGLPVEGLAKHPFAVTQSELDANS